MENSKETQLSSIEKRVNEIIDGLIHSAIEHKTPPEEVAMIDRVLRPFVIIVENSDVLSPDPREVLNATVSSFGNMLAHVAVKFTNNETRAFDLVNAMLAEMAAAVQGSMSQHFAAKASGTAVFSPGRPQGKNH